MSTEGGWGTTGGPDPAQRRPQPAPLPTTMSREVAPADEDDLDHDHDVDVDVDVVAEEDVWAPVRMRPLPVTGERPAQPAPVRPAGFQVDRRPSRSSQGPWPVAALVGIGVGCALLAIALVVAFQALGDEQAQSEPAASTVPDAAEVAAPSIDAPAALPISAPETGPYVRLDWDGQLLVVSGRVPDEQLSSALTDAAEAAYSRERVQSQVQVDPTLGQAPPWLASSVAVIPQLHLMSEVTAIVTEGRVLVTGRARAADDVTYVDRLLSEASGLPVDIRGVEISSLRAAIWFFEREGDGVTLTGGLPTEELRAGFVASAAARYGQENVIDASTVEPTAETALWMFEPDRMLDAFDGFADVDLQFGGEQFRFQLAGGPSFDPGSDEVSPELAVALEYLATTMLREPTMSMVITGHTDATGPDELNLALSEDRAAAAAASVIDAGVDPERVRSVGLGAAQPVASNDTDDGRERNRRIELVMTREPLGY